MATNGPLVDDALRRRLHELVREIPDYPAPGVVFRDITPVLSDASAFGGAVRALATPFAGQVDTVAAIEARGFLLGAPMALLLDAGLVPLRKVGKLPGPTVSENYELEYGDATLEMHSDALSHGHRVLVVDDVIATGGTATAALAMVKSAGAQLVGLAILLDIASLGGSQRLARAGYDVATLLTVD